MRDPANVITFPPMYFLILLNSALLRCQSCIVAVRRWLMVTYTVADSIRLVGLAFVAVSFILELNTRLLSMGRIRIHDLSGSRSRLELEVKSGPSRQRTSR